MTSPFGRPTLFTASFHKPISRSLCSLVNIFIGEELPHSFPEENYEPINCVEDLHTRIDILSREEIFDTVCVVDLADCDAIKWNIKYTGNKFRPPELVLLYPEVYWIFVVINKPDLPEEVIANHFVEIGDMVGLVELVKRHADGFRAWFDPSGFRHAVRGGDVPLKYGATIDDEDDFAILNGYVLYKNYYSTTVISTFAEMRKVLLEDKSNIELSVVMEDVELNFCDIKDDILEEDKLLLFTSNKEGKERTVNNVLYGSRADRFDKLNDAARIFVTSVSVIRDIRRQDSFVSKPYGGMYDSKLKLLRANHHAVRYCKVKRSVGGHSVGDARAQHVAEVLIDRARGFARDANTTESAVHASLLAFDAWRLLQGECLALSLEALDIQQRMEVTAECTFVGTSSTLDVGKRIKALLNDVERPIGKKKYAAYQKHNAMVEIANGLRQVYRDFDQFIEEEETIKIVRFHEWKLRYLTLQPGASVLNMLLVPRFVFSGLPSLYFIHVISALWKMGLWIVLWIFAFAGVYSMIFPIDMSCSKCTDICDPDFGELLMYSAETFFAPGSRDLNDCGSIVRIVNILQMVLGFTHIGIFVSYLFQKISRR